jgi:zinc protease
MKFLYRHAPAFPLTQVVVIFPRGGVCLDPPERQGLTRLTGRLLFTGAGGLSNNEFNSRLERLGAGTGTSLASDHVTFRMITLSRNLDGALDLLLAAIRDPNLDATEFERLREEVHSSWISDREEHKNQRVQDIYLNRMYGGLPTGYQADGTESGILACTIDDVRRQYSRLFGHGEPILGVLSDLAHDEMERRVLARFWGMPAQANGAPYPWDSFLPERPQGRQVTIIAEPHTQTDEVLAGAFSASERDSDWHIHRLIALIFGGDMNSRLFRAIRGERGFSYGANCWYESSQGRGPRDRVSPFTMYTFPTVEHTREALPLFVRLYDEFVERGVDEAELARAKESLIHSHAFLRDTPQKLLSLDCDQALYGIPFDDEETNRRKISAVTREDVQRVLRETHHPESLRVVLLGDPARLEPAAWAIPNVAGVEVIQYPAHPGGG